MNYSEDLSEFYRLMGDRDFWGLPDHQRHGALRGLWLSHQDSGDGDVSIQASTIEFERREALIMQYGIPTELKP